MEKVIIIRFGEIFLKGKNKKFFENLLERNIENALSIYDCVVEKSHNRFYVAKYDIDTEDSIIATLKKVFGVHSVSPAIKMPTDITKVASLVANDIPEVKSFRVTVKRADKTINLTSTEIACNIGGDLLALKPNMVVDLHNPELNLNVDIRENKTTYIFYETIKCYEGMPVGCSGKGLLLLSGGIDSPVAGFRMAKRGMQINGIHFHSYPFTSIQAKEKVIELGQIISGYCGHFPLFVVPFTKIQQAIHQYCREDFMITVMRMIMIEISERIAISNKCGALITGESLGQVASQTLESITVTNSRVKSLPIFRPLIDMDKTEIIKISKEIDTFETSILPYEDCCTIFLPKNPIIKPKVSVAEAEYNKIENLEALIEEAIQNVEVVKITNK
ncbi:MAG: tRNA 4-thiouridine(8) synthase ThiI, partial [Clostridia bacterium]|nr:tRNA 4-thiouridine(8) synthase ThiI [Clostridia bacterium]